MLNEGNIQVGTLLERREPGLVGFTRSARYGIPANIRRIAHDMCEARPRPGLQKILVPNPLARDVARRWPVDPERLERRLCLHTERNCDPRVDLIRADDWPQNVKAFLLPPARTDQARQQRQEKRSLAGGGLQKPRRQKVLWKHYVLEA